MASNHDASSQRLFTVPFLMMSLSAMLFFASMYLLIPLLPLYTVEIGGHSSDVGLVVGAFTITAVLVRPRAGTISDTIGRKPLFLGGSLVFMLAPLTYLFAQSVPLLMLARTFHGTGIALYTVGAWALVADTLPPHRRGEGMGVYSLASLLTMSVLPPLALPLLDVVGFQGLFVLASVLAAASLAIGLTINERRTKAASSVGPDFLSVMRGRWLWGPSLAIVAGGITFGTILSFIPLFTAEQGIGNAGLFYAVYAVSTVLTRIPIGRMSDRVGREWLIVPILVLTTVSMFTLSQSSSLLHFLAAAVLYGASYGSLLPTVTALVIDRASDRVRGTALSIVTSSFDLGIGLGSAALGFVGGLANYAAIYVVAGMLSVLGLAGFLLLDRRGERRQASERRRPSD